MKAYMETESIFKFTESSEVQVDRVKMKGIPAAMCVWQGVAMDSLKFYIGPKQPYGCLRGGP
jgi:hypothetical protein